MSLTQLVDPHVVALLRGRKVQPSRPSTEYFTKLTYADLGRSVKKATEFAGHRYDQNKENIGAAILEHGTTMVLRLAQMIHEGKPVRELEATYEEARSVAQGNYEASVLEETTVRVPAYVEQETLELRTAMDMALAGVEAVQAEARELERQLQAASAQLVREREAHEQELARLRDTLARERQTFIARERSFNEERRQMQHDLGTLRGVVASLNQELETLTAPTEASMSEQPKSSDSNLAPQTALERMSWHAYQQRERGMSPSLWEWRQFVSDHAAYCRLHLQEQASSRAA
ncbi:hypothetical protein [Deinococcus peraridilitoris]|uniref:Uncharacterized protein n=1 Tax=Deinococcus peraridilitoris (strain DSM 19664 / LMG 22246 / CIP 109416 / KR-200) TaxID=937777 RepID=K9ZZC0_DEIPD|nr:hypothetical protein [Deinococcus peraridilitoris]AFZ66090.1 hypothetical protein Deipe_0494 [Deinococcus peraridilitoris DSM 19664]